jgi:DNA-binding CsgD family transcriptional regulator
MVMADVVLRGRSEPMATALGVVRKVVRTGQGDGLVITGEAGIGKSALLTAVLREAGRLGAGCGTVRADRIGRIVPGGPLLTGLRDGPDPVLAAETAEPLAALVSQPLRLLDAVAAALEQRAVERAIVIAVDDAQWLDDLSAFVLRSLPGRLAHSPVAWLAVARTADLPFLAGAAGDAPLGRLELGPLADNDIIAIAHDQLGALPGTATRQLLEQAGGNPFLAVQLIGGLRHAQARGTDPAGLPGGLVRAVQRQLRTLPSQAVELVRVAAVFGEPLPLNDASELLDGLSAQAVAEAADEAIDAGMLASSDGALAFRHGLVRESVYAGLPARTRQFIHLTCARHLREAGSDALAVAAHAREAITPGDEAVALLLADAAGEAVTSMPKTAAELMLTAFGALRPGQPNWLGLGERCVELLSLVQRCTDALAVADKLMAYLDDDESAGRLEIALSRALWLTGRWQESEQRSRLALGGRPDREELAHIPVLVLVRGWLMAREGEPAMAVGLLTPLVKSALDELDPWPWKPGWMRMLVRTGLAAGDADFAARAVELAEEGASRNPGVATFEGTALGLRGLLESDLDRLARAAEVIAASPRPLIRAGVYEDHGRVLLQAGELTAGGGRLDQAWALYDEAGAHAARAEVQREMRAAGLRRAWWPAAPPRQPSGWAALTEAEVRVARLIAEGHTNKSAAAQLGVSPNTVGAHLRMVFGKLGVRSRVQLTNFLNRNGTG